MSGVEEQKIYEDIRNILERARGKVYAAANYVMVEAYWSIGRIIVESQEGNDFAEHKKY